MGARCCSLVDADTFSKRWLQDHIFSKDIPVSRYLWAALVPAGVGLVVFLIRSLIPMESSPLPDVFDQMILVLVWTPLGAFGEEIGWRGYLHKKLGTRLRGLASSILVGLLWMPIHITFLSQGPLILIFLALWFISLSIVAYALVQDSGFSVLVAAIFHMTINFISLLITDVYFNPTFWMINGIVWTIVAAVFVLSKREIYLSPKR
jgi:membrane protease YdiL (CAAX protease family)